MFRHPCHQSRFAAIWRVLGLFVAMWIVTQAESVSAQEFVSSELSRTIVQRELTVKTPNPDFATQFLADALGYDVESTKFQILSIDEVFDCSKCSCDTSSNRITQTSNTSVFDCSVTGFHSDSVNCDPCVDDSCVIRTPLCNRVGRAPFTFEDDAGGFLSMIGKDARAIFNRHNVLLLTIAGGASIAIHQDVNAAVRRNTLRHPNRWGNASETIGKFGEVTVQLPMLFALYGYSLHSQDPYLHDFTASLYSAYTISGLTTVTLKAAVNSDRPSDRWNGGQFGFPSFHVASSFTIASVIDEYYGPRVALPVYAFAGIIGWTRIDERDHDLSDVVFGAALGYVIGKSVAGYHRRNDPNARIFPFYDRMNRTGGVAYERWF